MESLPAPHGGEVKHRTQYHSRSISGTKEKKTRGKKSLLDLKFTFHACTVQYIPKEEGRRNRRAKENMVRTT